MELLTVLSSLPIGAVAGWFVGRRIRRLREQKEMHDTYRAMYMDLRQTLKELEDENRRLSRAVARLERALGRVVRCAYVERCPVVDELHDESEDNQGKGSTGGGEPNGGSAAG